MKASRGSIRMEEEKVRKREPGSKIAVFLAAFLLATFAVAYVPVWTKLVSAWSSSDEYSHGFLIIPLSIYILWRKRERLNETPIRPSGWGLALFVFSSLVYLFAHFAEIASLASFSLILVIAGVVLYLFGFRTLKEILFPLFLLAFMIPVPAQIYSELTIPLQLFVSKASVWVLANLGLPVYREGNVIHLPDRTLEVVRACSGLRSMVSLLALSAVFGYFTLKSNGLRLILFCVGVPVAILVNIIRILLIGFALQYFSYDLIEGSGHTVFGVLIFFLAMILIAATQEVLSIWEKSVTRG